MKTTKLIFLWLLALHVNAVPLPNAESRTPYEFHLGGSDTPVNQTALHSPHTATIIDKDTKLLNASDELDSNNGTLKLSTHSESYPHHDTSTGNSDPKHYAEKSPYLILIPICFILGLFWAILSYWPLKYSYNLLIQKWCDIELGDYSIVSRNFRKIFCFQFLSLVIVVIIFVIPSLPWLIAGGIGFAIQEFFHWLARRNNDRFNRDRAIQQGAAKETKKYTRVTRTDVDEYVPHFDTLLAQSYKPTSKSRSFNDITKFGKLKSKKPDLVSEDFCVLCLDAYTDDSEVLLLPCEHYFHFKCFRRMGMVSGLTESNPLLWAINFRCPLCQLNLARHFLFYHEHGLDPKVVKFHNKE